jgi:catechol 2,3-dioxygenase-like lactoylglutathione lyase family enzyme
MPSVTGIKETCLYCEDLKATRDFYTGLFNFPVMVEDLARFCALDVGGVSVLLLFNKGATLEPMPVPDGGGMIPAHDGDGALHIGFSIPAADYDAWEAELERRAIPIISETRWKRGGRSLYFHDPDGHVVELLTPGIWPTY